MRLACVSLCLIGCSSIRYDKPPSPAWIQQTPTKMDAGVGEVVGIAAATEDARGDAERGLASAKQRLAEALVSQVRTQSNDWSWSSASKEQTVVEQNVEVRTDIQLEGVTQTGAYRDEVTGSQYVRARVDLGAFVQKLKARVQPTIEALSRGLVEAKAMEQTRAIEAYLSLLKLHTVADDAVSDVRVLNALAPKDETLSAFRSVTRDLEAQTKGLAARTTFAVTVSGPDAALNERMRQAAREVFSKWGFKETVSKDPSVRLVVTLETKRLADEAISGRTAFVYTAIGGARLQQRDGDFSPLSVELQEGRYTESHASEPEARRRALQSGAETLMSLWRGLGRSLTQS
jgi:hypothetical protein